ncbi:putative leucine-rich repeat-containing protein DDB_G0290503 isoform X1 [Colletes gigas]|uniref:putative leucine-rich repeat-containing protein DDB_G0290503 isoform X1 n=1 Tax=Colletes gigas TaxID=935657 RepID=UPI001C9B3AD6|nr:putative leucine-rich repeat-containing protein DDB_G0290503 isoform X1 [Colletes gigas]
MSKRDSMIEPFQNMSTLDDDDCNCTTTDKSIRNLCVKTDGLKIIGEFQKLYEDRIENVDQEFESEIDQVCMKLEISREWIRNLKEQNIMLVQIVEDLEQAALNRVKLLEQKLKQSSMIVFDSTINMYDTEKDINTLSNRISNLEKDKEYKQQKIEFLQSDIRGLLELIRRAAQEKHWNLEGIKFFEIEPSDIPIPIDCSCDQEETNQKCIQSLKLQIEHFHENEKEMAEHQTKSEDEVTQPNKKSETKEDATDKYCTQFQNFSDNLKKRAKFENQISNLVVANDQQTFDNQVISYLTKVKSWMEQEKEDVLKLKEELEKTLEKLCSAKDQECHKVKNEFNRNNLYELTKSIDYINTMCSKKETSIASINSIILKLENNNSLYTESVNLSLDTDVNQQFKLMDLFRTYAIEAQITTEGIKEEIDIVVSTFKSRHQKYTDLNKEIVNVQNQLIRSREKIIETIDRLQLQEDERTMHNERISSGNIKLKDIKNEINHAQSHLLGHITGMQTNIKESIGSNYKEMCMCNELLHSVIEEIEQTSNSLQAFQAQGCCIASDTKELKNQFCEIDLFIQKLQQKMDEALLTHDVVETTLSQKEQKLRKLERKVDAIHSKIQHILEQFISSKNQVCDNNVTEPQLYTQTLNEILQIKQDLYRLRKEHDELKYKLSQKSLYIECNEDTCLWKCRMSDLQDQVKILQHEAKCNQEINDFLKQNIKSIEGELKIVQAKAQNYKRLHSEDNIELQKKIIQLENTLKLQEEIEYNLQQQLNDSKLELKKSKEVLNSFHAEHSIEETLLYCECNQFRHDTMIIPQLLKTLQDTMRSTKTGLQELKIEFTNLIGEDQTDSCCSAKSIMDKLQKYEDELENSFQEIEKLKNALCKKDKLLKDMDQIIKIQKDSLEMTQAELKELHQNLQKKIDNQDQIISHYEKEKQELLKQNELQTQTIWHLQNTVVKVKRRVDQMGYSNMSDLEEKCKTIRLLTVCVEETQSQYNECFAEAVKQNKLLDLQRDMICHLQQRICYLEYANCLTITSIPDTHFSILRTIQEQLEAHVNDIQTLKYKIDTLVQLKCSSENKYLNMKKLWQETEEKLQELKKSVSKPEQKKIYEDKMCQCKIEVGDKVCITQDTFNFNELTCNTKEQIKNLPYGYELQSEIDILTRENEDMKKQLQKCKLDFDIIDKELKIERESDTYTQQISFEFQKIRDTECRLRYENEQLRSDIKNQAKKTENLLEKLQLVKENDVKFEKLFKKLEDKQMQINTLYNQITNNEIVIKKQFDTIEELEKKLGTKDKEVKEYLSELNDAEQEMSVLYDRIQSLKSMLTRKSNIMSKLEADYEMLKKFLLLQNDNCILRAENNAFENKTTEDVCQLKDIIEKEQEKTKKLEESKCYLVQQLQKCMEQNCILIKEKAMVEENNSKIILELQETHKSMLELKKKCQLKNKSLACMLAELTETATSRSELCNQSQYVISCIRIWMEEQREYLNNLSSKLKSYQQQLLQLGFKKKALLHETKRFKRINHLLTQRLKRMHKYGGKSVKNNCIRCHVVSSIVAQNAGLTIPTNSKYSPFEKELRVSTRGNAWWFPKMKYLINELQKENLECNENFCNGENTGRTLEESHDCGYQSSTSK